MKAFVNEILEKETKAGKMYDFVFSDGNKVGAGKFPPKNIEVGDYVEYDISMNGNFKNFKPGSLSKLDKPAGVEAPSSKPGFVPSGDKRQETISKQAALNSALQFVGILASNDALPIAKTIKNDKKADLLLEVVNLYTGHFYKQSTGSEMEFEPSTAEASGSTANLAAREANNGDWNEE